MPAGGWNLLEYSKVIEIDGRTLFAVSFEKKKKKILIEGHQNTT
jgi:hypothetical protein